MRVAMGLIVCALPLSGCEVLDVLFSTEVMPASNPPGVSLGLYGDAPQAWAGASIAAADLRGDGGSDLAIALPGHQPGGAVIALWSGPWRGTFDLVGEAPTLVRIGRDRGLGALATGDFDGDGQADLAVAEPSGSRTEQGAVRVLSGPLPDGVLELDEATGQWQGEPGDSAGSVLSPLGDLDGDGIDDLLVSVAGGTELVLARGPLDRAGRLADFPDRVALPGPEALVDGLVPASGDLDGDGRVDLALGLHSDGSIRVFFAPRGRRTEADLVLDAPESGGISAVLIADLDGDGAGDLVVGAPEARDGRGVVRFYPGPLREGAEPLLTIVGVEGGALGSRLLAPGDFDGDGAPDLVAFRREQLRWVAGERGQLEPRGDGGSWTLLSVSGEGERDLQSQPAPSVEGFEGQMLGEGGIVAASLGDGENGLFAGAPAANGAGAIYGWLGAEAP